MARLAARDMASVDLNEREGQAVVHLVLVVRF